MIPVQEELPKLLDQDKDVQVPTTIRDCKETGKSFTKSPRFFTLEKPVLDENAPNRSVIDHEAAFPPENRTLAFSAYCDRKNEFMTKSQIALALEKVEEKRQRDARIRAMMEANELKKQQEAELAGGNFAQPGSKLGPDG